jgi:hypothetical protein
MASATYKIDLNDVTSAGYFTVTNDSETKLDDTPASGATKVGRVTTSDSTYYYTAIGSNGEDISSTGKNSTTWKITTYNGNDSIDASNLGDNTTVSAGNGDNLIKGGNYTTITTGSGKDSITAGDYDTVTSGAGNDSIVISGKDVVVNAGTGDDIVVVDSTGATVTLGDGKDTVSLGATAEVTLKDYAIKSDVIDGITAIEADALQDSLKSGEVFGTDGTLTVGKQKLTVGSTNGYYAVSLKGAEAAYIWATDNGGTLNASSYAGSAIITGANNGDTADFIQGTAKDDTIVAGSNDSVYGGKGDDSIVLTGDYDMVGLFNDGSKDNVTGFSEGYSDEASTLYFNGSLADAKFSLGAGSTVITNGKSTLTIHDAAAASKLKVKTTSASYNVEVIGDSGVTDSLDADATAVFGNGATLSVSDEVGDTVIDLGNTSQYGDTRYYSGVKVVDASEDSGDVVLVGSASASNSLMGGTGNTSLYGGGSKADSLKGGTGADTFFYGKSDGHDTVAGFDAEKDTLYFTSDGLTKLTRNEESLKFTFGTDSRNVLEVETSGGADDAISYVAGGQSYKAKIGVSTSANTFTYDSSVNYYQGGSKSDTLTASGDTANIWLDGSTGTLYSSIENVDASGVTGSVTLVGGTASEQLTAGSGEATLWGGLGGNDTLTGSNAATNTFFFGKNNGSDVITATNEGDRVMLYDVAFSDVKSTTKTSDGSFVVTLNDGSKLTIQNYSDNISYTLTDGTYTYSKNNGWQA